LKPIKIFRAEHRKGKNWQMWYRSLMVFQKQKWRYKKGNGETGCCWKYQLKKKEKLKHLEYYSFKS
jgi:hypothetical protein